MRSLAGAALLVFAAATGFAGITPEPSEELGFNAATAFHVSDVDVVNHYNGNLVITIPIGQNYAVDGALSYGLTLTYNSKVWEFERLAGQTYYHVVPGRDFTGALGWYFSLGELYLPCAISSPPCEYPSDLYRSSDGSRHELFETLHADDSSTHSNGVLRFTRDGTYLRIRDAGGGLYDVEFPDGTIQRFQREGSTHRTKLKQLRDRFGNAVDVTFSGNTVTLTDKHQRSQVIDYETVDHTRENYRQRPKKVTLTAFGQKKVVYLFTYTSTTFERPCTLGKTIDPGDASTIAVPVLSRIDL